MSPPAPTSPDGGLPRSSRTVLLIVFMTIVIDFIGFSVLIPVLPLYAERLGATPFQVGMILTVYALAQLMFLPAWGWVSDRVGRRPVLLVSLFGTAVSFVTLAFSDTIGMIYLARAMAGFFAASIGTAQAVVTDVTPPEQRARGMGLIGAAFGIGMVFGPAVGGVLASFDEKFPFHAIALLAAANLVLAWLRLPESRPPGLAPPDWSDFARSFVPTPLRLVAAAHGRRIGLFLYLSFHLYTAFAVLESMITLYLGERFGANELDVGLVFALIGAVMVVTQGYLLRHLVDRYGEVRLLSVGVALMGVSLWCVAAAPGFAWMYAIGPLLALGNGLAFPAFTSLYSQACRAEQAGELLAQGQSMATTGRIVGPMGAGWVMGFALGAPFWIAGVMMFAALALFAAARGTLVEAPVQSAGSAGSHVRD